MTNQHPSSAVGGEGEAAVVDAATGGPVPGPGTRATVEAFSLHHSTAALINMFAMALAEKLAKAERKYGYSDGWKSDDWQDECRRQLHHHAANGDPRDVAAYAAFCWYHGWPTAPPSAPTAAGNTLAEIRAQAWQELLDKDDRTSPEDCPEMCLITREELDELLGLACLRGRAVGQREARDIPKTDYAGSLVQKVAQAFADLNAGPWQTFEQEAKAAIAIVQDARPSRGEVETRAEATLWREHDARSVVDADPSAAVGES